MYFCILGSGAHTTKVAIDTPTEMAIETATTDGFESSTKGNTGFTFKMLRAFQYKIIHLTHEPIVINRAIFCSSNLCLQRPYQ